MSCHCTISDLGERNGWNTSGCDVNNSWNVSNCGALVCNITHQGALSTNSWNVSNCGELVCNITHQTALSTTPGMSLIGENSSVTLHVRVLCQQFLQVKCLKLWRTHLPHTQQVALSTVSGSEMSPTRQQHCISPISFTSSQITLTTHDEGLSVLYSYFIFVKNNVLTCEIK